MNHLIDDTRTLIDVAGKHPRPNSRTAREHNYLDCVRAMGRQCSCFIASTIATRISCSKLLAARLGSCSWRASHWKAASIPFWIACRSLGLSAIARAMSSTFRSSPITPSSQCGGRMSELLQKRRWEHSTTDSTFGLERQSAGGGGVLVGGQRKKPHRAAAMAGSGDGTEKRPSLHHNNPVGPCREFGHGLSVLPSRGQTRLVIADRPNHRPRLQSVAILLAVPSGRPRIYKNCNSRPPTATVSPYTMAVPTGIFAPLLADGRCF